MESDETDSPRFVLHQQNNVKSTPRQERFDQRIVERDLIRENVNIAICNE